jgi:hypothetical protein
MLTVTPPGNEARIVFEIGADTVAAMRAGTLPTIEWVERCG